MTEIESVEAENHFSDLLQRVRNGGEKFIVTEHGEPVATICPLEGRESTFTDFLIDNGPRFDDLELMKRPAFPMRDPQL